MDTNKQDRAKQFMAFEALTGLKEVFEEKEHECEEKENSNKITLTCIQ
jgi:hypothetical protein